MVKRRYVYEGSDDPTDNLLKVLGGNVLGVENRRHKKTIKTAVGIIEVIPGLKRLILRSKGDIDELEAYVKKAGLKLALITEEHPGRGIKTKPVT